MNDNCECPMFGYCARHKMMKGPERHKKCQGKASDADCGLKYWNAWEEGRLGATKPEDPKLNPKGFCAKISDFNKSNIGTKLSEIIKRERGKEIECEECRQRIELLNSMTKEDALKVKDNLVKDIAGRAYNFATFFEKGLILADNILNTHQLEKIISQWYNEAIETAEENVSIEKKAITTPAIQDVGVVRYKALTSARNPTNEQNKLFIRSKRKTPDSDPFRVRPLINLVYHIWPVRNVWIKHLNNIKDLIKLCDGKIIIGICYDETTDSPEYIKELIGNKPIYIVSPNIIGTGDIRLTGKQFGELSTLIPAMELLRETDDSVTIYAHAKGMRDHTKSSLAVKLWTEMMYETVSFNIEETIRVIESGFDCVGSFKTYGYVPLLPKNMWHYSGTFFNFRTKSMYQKSGSVKKFQLKYGGTESWLGDHIEDWKSYCVFQDNSPLLRQYNEEYMKDIISQQLIWESKRFGDTDLEQHKREFDWFLNKIDDIKNLLIIGSRHGGLEYYISKKYKNIKITSIDINPLRTDTQQNLIIGDSHDINIQKNALSHGPYDAVFIDGDHTYEGVKLDWEFAKSTLAKKIFFHDHTDGVYHNMCNCHVDKLWKEILNENYKTEEISVGCGWGGIGLVYL